VLNVQFVVIAVCTSAAIVLAAIALTLPLSPAFIACVMGAFVAFIVAVGYFIDTWLS
jgi:hypothetical protein